MIYGAAFNPGCATLEFSPNHLPWSQHHLVTSVIVVLDEERPVLLHLLPDVEDGRDDVAPGFVQVGDEGGPKAFNIKGVNTERITC